MELPEGCIAHILSLTTPADACRLSVVSVLFNSAAESDAVWCRFLPSDVVSIVSQSDSQCSVLANSPSKKALYLALSDRPIIMDQGKKVIFFFDLYSRFFLRHLYRCDQVKLGNSYSLLLLTNINL